MSFATMADDNYENLVAPNDPYVNNDGLNHLFVGTGSSILIALYHDGVLADSTLAQDAGTFSGDLQLGETSNNWQGTCSSLAIWDRALRPSEVKELYNLGPKFGLESPGIDIVFSGAHPAVSTFNAAWAINSNIRLQ